MVNSAVSTSPVPAEPVKIAEEKASAPKSPKAASASGALAYAHEDLHIRVESRDGDVLEVRRSLTVAAGYTASPASLARRNGGGDFGLDLPEISGSLHAEEAKAGKEGIRDAFKWAQEVARELEKQQAKLLESLMKDEEGQGARGNRFVMFGFVLAVGPGAAADWDGEEARVPEYWNAENTSNRIVEFATSFAAIHGDGEFAETIRNAVMEGFNQAGEILGALPGAAGKLYRDTKNMVFEKLDKWLEEWQAGLYNQGNLAPVEEAASVTT